MQIPGPLPACNPEICIFSPQPRFVGAQGEDELHLPEWHISLEAEMLSPQGDSTVPSLELLLPLSWAVLDSGSPWNGVSQGWLSGTCQDFGKEKSKTSELEPSPQTSSFSLASLWWNDEHSSFKMKRQLCFPRAQAHSSGFCVWGSAWGTWLFTAEETFSCFTLAQPGWPL